MMLLVAVRPVDRLSGQQQRSQSAPNWPCGGRLDPSYFNIAEGSGGQLLLLAPDELAGAAPLLTALSDHPQTIFRLAGAISPGPHDFSIPIDSSVESVVFSLAVQCLQEAVVLTPSGLPASGPGVTDLTSFRAERLVIVPHPEAGTWKVRITGSGVSGVVAQAKSSIGLTRVAFSSGADDFHALPIAGKENRVSVTVGRVKGPITGAIVNGAFREVAALTFESSDAPSTFVARFTPGPGGFRVVVRGTDASGAPFQRVSAALLTAR